MKELAQGYSSKCQSQDLNPGMQIPGSCTYHPLASEDQLVTVALDNKPKALMSFTCAASPSSLPRITLEPRGRRDPQIVGHSPEK